MTLYETRERTYTATDLWAISHQPGNGERHFELSQGMLIEMAPAGLRHGGLAGDLGRWIGVFVDEHDLGLVTAAETGFILHTDEHGKDTVRAPDVGFISTARLPEILPEGYAPFAPDLAVEVVSPGDSADEIELKVAEYLMYGTRLVWVFYSKSRSVVVHAPDSVCRLGMNDVLDGEDVLPGFRIPVKDIFS